MKLSGTCDDIVSLIRCSKRTRVNDRTTNCACMCVYTVCVCVCFELTCNENYFVHRVVTFLLVSFSMFGRRFATKYRNITERRTRSIHSISLS